MGLKSSVISFPNRGHYGNARWRGNTSGHVVKAFLEQYHHKESALFCDPFEGGGTSQDVSVELGIRYRGLDLHKGFNILKDSLIDTLGEPAHTVFAHPPYAGMIAYSGGCWGDEPLQDDLSHNANIGEFVEKLQLALANIYQALEEGGTYAVLMGNWRHRGQYINLSSLTERVASGTLKEEIIKIQHNCRSDRSVHSGKSYIPISHEKLLIFAKDKKVRSYIDQLILNEKRMRVFETMSWRTAIQTAFLGKKEMSLQDLYETMAPYATARASNQFWREKVRQQVQNKKYFSRVGKGVYRLSGELQSAT